MFAKLLRCHDPQASKAYAGLGLSALGMHQINGFDHLLLGSRKNPEADFGPARVYVERSYFFDETVCVGANADKTILPWLRDVGLAPREILEIPNGCMFQGLKNSQEIFSELENRVRDGAYLHFFRTTALEQELIQRLNINWSDTFSCDPKIAEKIADKGYIRKVASNLGVSEIFPPHMVLPCGWSEEQVESAVWRVASRGRLIGMDRVVVKRTDLASGDGFCDWFKNGRAEFCKAHRGHELIIETWIHPHTPISNQWLILDGKAIYIGTSRQIQHGFVHKGNVIASQDAVVDPQIAARLRYLVAPLLEHAIAMGYNGIIGFDAVYSPEQDKMWLTEANARVTAGTYAYALASRLEFSPWAVACKIIEPAKGLKTFADVVRSLGFLLYKAGRENGIAPYMISGLTLPDGQRRLGLMSIANHVVSAERFLEDAEQKLSA
ncbi:MAG: hypothetical protein P1P90_06565 [Patescibacteria group bacterium]|nr:hypothetical protein [Patescibacteria group bacterium]